MKIYFAGPLFSKAEKEFNQKLTDQLEKLGFEVFLPQRDGVEKSKPPFDQMPKEEKRKSLFILDRDQIFDCDIFLFILDGRVPDEGACVELGIAYTQKLIDNKNRKLIGLQTDKRATFLSSKLNPMISIPLDSIFETEEELIQFLLPLK
ncbi:MAG: nucleoside 2-deoxyribosyltransferase [Bacteroidota bacterium]